MLVCPKCESSLVVVDITYIIRLVATPQVIGNKVKEIYDRCGVVYDHKIVLKPRLEEIKDIRKVRVESNTPTICRDCGFHAELESFLNKDQCRCSAVTDKIGWCSKYGLLVCGHCLETYNCSCCDLVQCDLHPTNLETGGYMKLLGLRKRRST